MDNASGVPVYLNVWHEEETSTYKLRLSFFDSEIECVVPISEGQYKVLLDCVNRNFLNEFAAEAPQDDELGMVSGIRFMVPLEQMNVVYGSDDRNQRIIMVHVEPLKEKLIFYRVSKKPDNKVISFEAPFDWLKTRNKAADFGSVEILDFGKTVKFGGVRIPSREIIKLFA